MNSETKTNSGRLHGEERRRDLIQATYQMIVEKGFEGLRVRDVAAQTGVNIATLHYYFPSKEDLVQGVVSHLLQLFITVKAPRTAEPETFRQKIRLLFADLQYQLQVAPEMFVVLNELHLRSQRDPAMSAILKKLNEGWRAHIAGIFEEGLAQQAANPDLSSDTVASILIALIKGMSIQSISQLDQFNFDQISSAVESWLSQP